MLQRGVDLSNLDVSYVSSLSWYFLLMFGLNDVYALILGESLEMDEAQRMMQVGGWVGGWICPFSGVECCVCFCFGSFLVVSCHVIGFQFRAAVRHCSGYLCVVIFLSSRDIAFLSIPVALYRVVMLSWLLRRCRWA